MSRHVATDRSLRAVACWAAPLLLLAVTGCGGGDTEIDSPTGAISALVSNVADAAGEQESFEALFAAGAAPDDSQRAQYAKYLFDLRSADSSGETVTATVEVIDMDTDEVIGEVTWTAVQEGKRWKLKTAPLP